MHSFFCKRAFNTKYKQKYITNSSILENPQFGRVSGCCHSYCNKLCDWWIKRSAVNMIGWCNCPISSIQLQPTVWFLMWNRSLAITNNLLTFLIFQIQQKEAQYQLERRSNAAMKIQKCYKGYRYNNINNKPRNSQHWDRTVQ